MVVRQAWPELGWLVRVVRLVLRRAVPESVAQALPEPVWLVRAWPEPVGRTLAVLPPVNLAADSPIARYVATLRVKT
jgi:hypothetical protein